MASVCGTSRVSVDTLRDYFGFTGILDGNADSRLLRALRLLVMTRDLPLDVRVPPAFDSDACLALLRRFWAVATCLADGNYEKLREVCASAVPSPSAQEAVDAATAFTGVAGSLLPGVVCVHVDYASYGDKGDAASAGGLLAVAGANLKKRGFVSEFNAACPPNEALESLTRENCCLMVVVTNVDALFARAARCPEMRQTSLDIANDVKFISEQTTGLCAVVMCGSEITEERMAGVLRGTHRQ